MNNNTPPPRYVLFNDGTPTHHDDPETNLIRVHAPELEHHKQQLSQKFT